MYRKPSSPDSTRVVAFGSGAGVGQKSIWAVETVIRQKSSQHGGVTVGAQLTLAVELERYVVYVGVSSQ